MIATNMDQMSDLCLCMITTSDTLICSYNTFVTGIVLVCERMVPYIVILSIPSGGVLSVQRCMVIEIIPTIRHKCNFVD